MIIRIISGWLLVASLVLGMVGCGQTPNPETEKPIKEKELGIVTLREAIEIGREELKRIEYSYWSKKLIVEADDNNTVWNRHIRSSPSSWENEMRALKGEKYWAIYYSPKWPKDVVIKGGDGWVFIDRSNGKVIRVILGE